jgi:hypothetical protein
MKAAAGLVLVILLLIGCSAPEAQELEQIGESRVAATDFKEAATAIPASSTTVATTPTNVSSPTQVPSITPPPSVTSLPTNTLTSTPVLTDLLALIVSETAVQITHNPVKRMRWDSARTLSLLEHRDWNRITLCTQDDWYTYSVDEIASEILVTYVSTETIETCPESEGLVVDRSPFTGGDFQSDYVI